MNRLDEPLEVPFHPNKHALQYLLCSLTILFLSHGDHSKGSQTSISLAHSSSS